ncbi:MAG: DUF4907 domain-containing protein [Proteobacteria bacterium]|nr:DUF4907 domain-containing protein [Pseudomonadota bacterium]MBU1388585.1 DUF4907 domain-containing protein [Pseudomonadota bacterium]MBU1541741.1 DUF4907 domain-containing protein [Pseudomonadota bacterium]MBU2431508.1 DUF4907 domain-containing protein [Pseudomonadota bacterium]MBU2482964.1 DUF4907 domain-containing protein [Pseudomonadota bacterium]
MDTISINDTWFYVIIQNPGIDEEFLGFNDETTHKKFIPAFKTKEDAKKCFALMPRDLFKEKYEAQAVIGEDILLAAEEQGHKVYLLDEKGRILQHLN